MGVRVANTLAVRVFERRCNPGGEGGTLVDVKPTKASWFAP